MAQRSGQSPRNPPSSTWDNNPYMPTFFDTLSPPAVPTLSSNNNVQGHFTNTNLFPGQEAHNIRSEPHQDPTLQAPFLVNSANGTGSRVDQGQELLRILLQEAAPTKREIEENIMRDVKPAVKMEIFNEIRGEFFNEFKDIKAEVIRLRSIEADATRLKSIEAEMAHMRKLWTQQQRYQQQNPLFNIDKTSQ
ncbi:hypothetical protein V496_02794 [Pseudogymnoascus sp. VKM F-4515 (FW-2607)]|nr:hypothetical protein V496_02794 [Pseudogymnoascus sp. VKM F-4515 (FW-2607)]